MIDTAEAARALRRIPSEVRDKANSDNGRRMGLKNRKALEDIPCCGREPHLRSCLRFRAMRRREANK